MAGGFSARVLLDSTSPAGARLVTMELRYPRFIHSEVMTHRVFSRNSASSRAVPIKKMIATVREHPAMPIFWGRNQSGMAAREEIEPDVRALAEREWRSALESAIATAEKLSDSDVNLHKQLVNRILEPFAWMTTIVTATEWANFFTQRCHPDAQPELAHLAALMLAEFRGSRSQAVPSGDWHLPLIQSDEGGLILEDRKKISVARCARVSYLTHDGRRDPARDLDLYEKLLGGGANGHWSPFEHVAAPQADGDVFFANFRGWRQLRSFFLAENVRTFPDERAMVST
ncbi:MAG: FAD-dependent thymidylate synthase [Candidatus Baltobacteraceae bacterium]